MKQRRESVEQYEEAGRDDLIEMKWEEMEVLEEYPFGPTHRTRGDMKMLRCPVPSR
ncbi:MAG: hypothetical protein BRD31_00235 [Bacteroidetes bacterium QH_2_64_26]|nr:MAG: hypothetical protein BRD31_00235 [Bacteroidetes bacterium QH_2_64_26]